MNRDLAARGDGMADLVAGCLRSFREAAMSDGAPSHRGLQHERLALRVVEPGEVAGIVIPGCGESSPWLRGYGGVDYACGGCGALIAIGVRPGAFHSLLFACACGALNRAGEGLTARR